MVERLHRQMKDALRARGGTAAWADHLPWVMLGIRASPKEESGTLAGEAALGHVLAVPGQLLTTTAPPTDTPAPPVVISAAKQTYAEAAATPPLDGATHVYVQRGGVGPPLADNNAGPYMVLEKGPKVIMLQVGTRERSSQGTGSSLTWCLHSWRLRGRRAGGDRPGNWTRSSSALRKICRE